MNPSASQIHDAGAAGFKKHKGIEDLFGTSAGILSLLSAHKKEIAPNRVKLFRKVSVDAQHDKPYKT